MCNGQTEGAGIEPWRRIAHAVVHSAAPYQGCFHSLRLPAQHAGYDVTEINLVVRTESRQKRNLSRVFSLKHDNFGIGVI